MKITQMLLGLLCWMSISVATGDESATPLPQPVNGNLPGEPATGQLDIVPDTGHLAGVPVAGHFDGPPLIAPVDGVLAIEPQAPIPVQILMEVTVFGVDCGALANSDVSLRDLVELEKQATPGVVLGSLSSRECRLLTQLITSSNVAEVISRPKVITLEGREAQVQIGQEVPLATIEETVNGTTSKRIETKPVGITLHLTPTKISSDGLHLALVIQQSDLGDGDTPPTIPPTIKSRRLETTAKVASGSTLLVTESSLLKGQRSAKDGERILLMVTPKIVTQLPAPDLPPMAPPAVQPPRRAVPPRRDLTPKPADVPPSLPRGEGAPLPPPALPSPSLPPATSAIVPLPSDPNVGPGPGVLPSRPAPSATPALPPLGPGAPTRKPVPPRTKPNDPLAAPQPASPEQVKDTPSRVAPRSARQPRSNETRPQPPLRTQPPAVRRPVPSPHKPPRSGASSIEHEMKLLRQDVQHLRRDVKRLIQLLEQREDTLPSGTLRPADRSHDSSLSAVPPDASVARWHSALGIKVAEFSFPQSVGYRVRYRGGLKIVEIDEQGPAAIAGMRTNDVLIGLDRWETVTHLNLSYVMDKFKRSGDAPLKFYIVRDGETLYGTIKLPSLSPDISKSADQGTAATPEAVIRLMAKGGDPAKLKQLLSEKAQREVERLGIDVSDWERGKFNVTVDSALYPHPGASTVIVRGSVQQVLRDGSTQRLPVQWHMRRESGEWKLTGMSVLRDPSKEPEYTNFEDIEGTVRDFSKAAAKISTKSDRVANKYVTRTANFTLSAPTREIANQLLPYAEKLRRELAVKWLGAELERWPEPCEISVSVNDSKPSSGVTSYVFRDGTPVSIDMKLTGSESALGTALAHEIMHVVLASHFGRPLPRWIDEGIATTESATSKKEKMVQIAKSSLLEKGLPSVTTLMNVRDYPSDFESLQLGWAHGYTFARMLVDRADEKTLIAFIEEGLSSGDWSSALLHHFELEEGPELKAVWHKSLGGPPPVMRL